MASLLDLDDPQQQGGGLLGLLNAIPGAAQSGGVNGQPPQLDPYIASLVGPQALAAAQANYRRNVMAGIPAVARSGGSLADLMSAPGAQAGQQYTGEVAQAAKDAMLLRQMRMAERLQMQGGDDPMAQMQQGAGLAVAGFPGAQQVQDAAKAQITPAYVALYHARQAAQNGDVIGARGFGMQYLKETGQLTVDRNGVVYFPGGLDKKGMPNFLFANVNTGRQGGNQGVALMPGEAQAVAQTSRAQASGPAAFNIIPKVDPDTGEETPSTAAQLAAAAGGGGVPGGTAPSSSNPAQAGNSRIPAAQAPGTKPVLKLGPQQEDFLAGRGKGAAEYLNELQKSAESASDTNYSLNQMLQAAKGATLGPGAPTRMWLEKNFSAVGQLLGVEPSGELSNYQDLEKYANKIAFAATRQMGAREAAQIVELQMQSNPNKALNQEAFLDISNSMKAMNQYIIDKNAALAKSGKNAQAAAAQWTQRIDPRVWALTLSPEMGAKWAETIGPQDIHEAFRFMTPQEKAALVNNIPPELAAKWLKQKKPIS